jgi:hypothetical protein
MTTKSTTHYTRPASFKDCKKQTWRVKDQAKMLIFQKTYLANDDILDGVEHGSDVASVGGAAEQRMNV